MNDKEKLALALGLIGQLIEIQLADDEFESILHSLTEDELFCQETFGDGDLWDEIKTNIRAIQSDMRQQELRLMSEVQNDIDDDFFARHGSK